MAETLRRRNSGDDSCQADVCQSRQFAVCSERETHSDGTNCPDIAFTFRVSAKARLLNKRYSEHLERNEHKSVEDLHEDISCGIQLQHKLSRQHKYLLASVDVKNPQANCDDLENSVPPEQSVKR